jgi:predicted amidohydrolase YtcJ
MFGQEETSRMLPVRSLLDLGIPVLLNTDFPNAPLDPLLTLRAAVDRRSRSGTVIGAAEAITAREAWSLATAGAAYGAFEDQTRGRIAPGYLADLVVLSADPFDLDALGPDAVDGTVVGGRPVHVTDGLFSVAAG